MYYSAEQEKRINAEQAIVRSGEAAGVSLCQYGGVSCARCCLPHIGGDSYVEGSEAERTDLLNRDRLAYDRKYADSYLGPRNTLMKFRNFNPLMDLKIEASQYEDSFPDVGREEMERRFAERRTLFLAIYDRARPEPTLRQYMNAAQKNEGYTYKPKAISGPASLYIGGSVPKSPQKGELPECQLLGFVDRNRTVGCMAHPLAETAKGHDGRDQVGFFKNTGCCRNVGCEACREFPFLSPSARKIFDKAVEQMSWYEYSRHATSVLVYYLRSYDHLLRKLDEEKLLDTWNLERLAGFTNHLFSEWPLRNPDLSKHAPNHPGPDSGRMDSLDVLSANIPLEERMLYLALDTWFVRDYFQRQLRQARHFIKRAIRGARLSSFGLPCGALPLHLVK
jgi:hypothetical protein